jgi:hypothetical protein
MKKIIHKVKTFFQKPEEPVEAGFACPICKSTIVHSHTSGEIVEFHNRLKAEAVKVSQPNQAPKRKPAPKKDVPGEVKTTEPKRKRHPRTNNHGR